MNIEKVETAMEEATRFLGKAKALIERCKEEKRNKIYTYAFNPFTGSKESGAVKRSSLDLSNTLAEMRKPE